MLVAPRLHAEPSEADRATARALASEGYKALQEKNYEVAADRFRRADALIHAPTLVVDHARALVGLGKLVEAHERYELIAREGIDPKSPKSWQKALETATKELEVLKPRLAWVTIQIKGPSEPKVLVDDGTVPTAALGVRRAINPGKRTIRASADGYLPGEKTLTFAEGEEQSVEIELLVDPNAQKVSVEPEPQAGTVQDAPKRRSNALAYVMLGVGGVALAGGGVTGVLALGKRSDLEKVCNDAGRCPSSAKEDLDAYHLFGLISPISLGVGVAAAATGITLLVTRPKAQTENSASIEPYFGLTSVGATGRF